MLQNTNPCHAAGAVWQAEQGGVEDRGERAQHRAGHREGGARLLAEAAVATGEGAQQRQSGLEQVVRIKPH